MESRKRFGKNTGTQAGNPIAYLNNQGYNGDGGGPMNTDYVTHKEFDDAMHKIDNRFTKLEGRFDTMDAKIDNLSRIMWWLMGLVGAGLIIPLLTFVIHFIMKG